MPEVVIVIGGREFPVACQAGEEHFLRSAAAMLDAEAAPLARVGSTANLAALPPATVITAQYDPLRDEGMAYADKLKAAGVSVDAAIAPGMIHGFYSMFEAVPDAWSWINRGGANLKAALA